MRKLLGGLLMCGLAGLVVSQAYAVPCGVPIFMLHQVSNFVCKDATEVAALAWQVNSAAIHSGTENIACEAAGLNGCSQGGSLNDGVVVIDFDWANPGIAGCPQVGTVNNRVVVAIQANDGRGVIASIGGTSVDLTSGYIVDLAHQGGAAGDPTAPQTLACGLDAGRPTVASATNNADGTTTLSLRFTQPHVYSDCDPNSVGQALGFCGDNFVPTASIGKIYTSLQACGTRPSIDKALWKSGSCSTDPKTACSSNTELTDCPTPTTGVCQLRSAPLADGSATLTTARPTTANSCLFVGATTVINSTESEAVTGFVSVGGPGVASPIAMGVRAEQAGGNVRIRWHTDVEIGLAGFNILAEGKQGTRRVNDVLIAADGNGGGKSYDVLIPRGKFQSSRTVIIESALTDNTTLKSAPANF